MGKLIAHRQHNTTHLDHTIARTEPLVGKITGWIVRISGNQIQFAQYDRTTFRYRQCHRSRCQGWLIVNRIDNDIKCRIGRLQGPVIRSQCDRPCRCLTAIMSVTDQTGGQLGMGKATVGCQHHPINNDLTLTACRHAVADVCNGRVDISSDDICNAQYHFAAFKYGDRCWAKRDQRRVIDRINIHIQPQRKGLGSSVA